MTPIIIFCINGFIPIIFIKFTNIVITRVPTTALKILPSPPESKVPPIIVAAIDSSRKPFPARGFIPTSLYVYSNPPIPEVSPLNAYTNILTFLTLTPL